MAREPVLKRDHHAAVPEQRRNLLRRRLDVPQFDAEHHDVGPRDVADRVGRTRVGDMHRSRAALDAKSVRANRLQMTTARDERDVVAR